MAHIHCCAPLGTNAGVATTVPAFAGFPLGVTQGTYLSQLFSLEDSSFYNPAFVNMQAGGTPAENPRAGVVFLWAPASFKPGTVRGAEISLLSFRQDWRGSEDQALQPVRQQAQLCVRAGLGVPHRSRLHRDPTAWLVWKDSNSETSSQIIPLKGRIDLRESSRILATETIRV